MHSELRHGKPRYFPRFINSESEVVDFFKRVIIVVGLGAIILQSGSVVCLLPVEDVIMELVILKITVMHAKHSIVIGVATI